MPALQVRLCRWGSWAGGSYAGDLPCSSWLPSTGPWWEFLYVFICWCFSFQDSKSQITPCGVQLKVWRLRSLSYGPQHQEPQITNLIGHFVSKGQLMKHLEFFDYMTLFSGFCFDPDSVNFFFYCGFWFFSPTLEIEFIWCTQVLCFSIKKNLHKTASIFLNYFWW